MIYPSVGQYTEAIKLAEQSPEDYFATLTTLRPVLDEDNNPVMSSGNFAVVFKMVDQNDGKFYALKCFTRDQEGRDESYRLIADELQDVSSDYLTKIQYLDKELFVDTNTDDNEFPVLLMDWVEGETLDKYIKKNISEPLSLGMIVDNFYRLAQWLMEQPFAHGDLKFDNIIVKDDLSLVLIDYDGMFVRKMKGQKAREVGTPDFRHPRRTEDDFNEHIDDFAVVTILLSIKALYLNKKILEDCGIEDGVLLHEKDFVNLSQSVVNQKLQELIYDYNSDFAGVYAAFIMVLANKVISKELFDNLLEGYGLGIGYEYRQHLLEMGNNYYFGWDVEKDYTKAVEWYTKAAKMGDDFAQGKLGCCYYAGDGVEQNYQKSVEWFTKSAEQGNAASQYNLGLCYKYGLGVNQDFQMTIDLWTKAAKNGDDVAQYSLGICYLQGNGVEKDRKKAIYCFKKAAEHGNSLAQYILGDYYRNGVGVEQDLHKAFDLYWEAAIQGYDRAQYELGLLYEKGQGVTKDYQKAIVWYEKAAEQGYDIAQRALNKLEQFLE